MAETASARRSREILRDLGQIILRFRELESIPRDFGTGDRLFPAEIHVVECIGDHPGVTATFVAKTMRVTKGAISQMLRRLVAKGMVAREPRGAGGRAVRLTLTTLGRVAHAAHARMHAALEERFATHLGVIPPAAHRRIRSIAAAILTDLDVAIRRPESTPGVGRRG